MKEIISNLFSAPKKVILGGGLIYFAGYLALSYTERGQVDVDLAPPISEQSSSSQTSSAPPQQEVEASTPAAQRAPASRPTARAQAQPAQSRTETSRRSNDHFRTSRPQEDEEDNYESNGHSSRRPITYQGAYIPNNSFAGGGIRGGQRSPSQRGSASNPRSSGTRTGGGIGTTSSAPKNFGGSFEAAPSSVSSSDEDDSSSGASGSPTFTDVPSDSSSTEDSPPTCNHDKGEGIYGAEFEVKISCSEKSKIYYCLQEGGGCCDPHQSNNLYTGPILIGPDNDNYCLSYYGLSDSSLLESSLGDVAYTLDTTPPALMTDYSKTHIQTLQAPLLNTTQSTDFGTEDNFFHQINLKNHDPVALSWDCEDILFEHPTLSAQEASPIVLDYDVSGLAPSDQIDQHVSLLDLKYGDNFITTILEDETRNLFSCQTHRIVLKDFQIYVPSPGTLPPVDGAAASYGWFAPYGHYQAAPNTTKAGEGQSLQDETFHQHGYFAITH